jgi:hypothetical protein
MKTKQVAVMAAAPVAEPARDPAGALSGPGFHAGRPAGHEPLARAEFRPVFLARLPSQSKR